MREEMWASAFGVRCLDEAACVLKPFKAWLWLWGQTFDHISNST